MTERNDDGIMGQMSDIDELEMLEEMDEMDSQTIGLIPTMLGIMMVQLGLTSFTFTKEEYQDYFDSEKQLLFKINEAETTLELVAKEVINAMIESANAGEGH